MSYYLIHTDLNSQVLIQGNNNFGHNLSYPKFICPTNIPLLKNSSLSSYFDIMYEIYTLDVKNPQDYYKSIFQDNIVRIKSIREENKLKAFHEYDLQSRKNIIYQKPVIGIDLTRLIKLNLIPANLSTKQYSYGNSSSHKLFYNNINNSIIFNKFFKKTNFDEIERKEKLNNRIFEGIYKDRQLQNELDRLIALLEEKEKELEEEKEKEMKVMNMGNIINQHSNIRKMAGINVNNQDYKNNLIQNQNKKINSSINISNLNLNLNKNKHLKLNNIQGENVNKDENVDNNKDKIANGSQENDDDNEKIKDKELFDIQESTSNDVEMHKENDDLDNKESSMHDEINERDQIFDLEKDKHVKENIENVNEEKENSEVQGEMDIEINNQQANGKTNENHYDKFNGINHQPNDLNQNNNLDSNNINNKEPDTEEINISINNAQKNDAKKNSNINHFNQKVIHGQNAALKQFNQITNALYNYTPDPDKLKEIEDLKNKISIIKNLLKPKQINKIKENFVEMKLNNESNYDSIKYVHTEALNEMIFNPQKMINICEELMTRYKFFIPKIISSGPQLVPSKVSSDNQQLNTRYRMLYNNLNRVPNVQKYLSLFKIISLPEKKLVEYDSGKLMKLARLLKTLKQNKSKALIFTQV